MKNKFSRKSLLLVSMTVVLATVINLFAGVVAFADDATTTDVIEIESAEELKKIGNDDAYPLSGNYKLTKNIDLSKTENNTKVYAAWTPIGGDDKFTGVFDGNGYTVSGFNISTGGIHIGFFGKVEDGIVKNLTLADATVNLTAANHRAGAFAGLAGNGSIIGCKTESTVNVICNVTSFSNDKSVDIGGIVGYLSAGANITYCENNAKITVENCKTSGETYGACTGGIVGHLYGGTISYCVNNGAVTLTDYAKKKGNACTAAGGIVGNQNVKWSNTGTVEYCINNGDVSDLTGMNSTPWNASAGGIVGTIRLESGTSNTKNCYNFGSVTVGSSNSNVDGQIVGYEATAGTNITGNYGTSKIGALYGGGSDKAAITTPNFEIKSEAELKASEGYKAIATEVAEHLTGVSTDLYGYQTTKKTDDNKFDMRLVATLSGDISKCTNVGFQVSVTYKLDGADHEKAPENDITVTTLYEAITATDGAGAEDNTKTHTAVSLGGDYIFVLACKNLPADATDITFKVTTFYTGANGEVYSETETFDITVPEDTLPEAAA